ncbi:recombinase family protein [Streptomyces sp. NPDC058280]|uniref:recombinase family protein n=1 Tax=Streptomyces sp. NPDC058280 TaxID=3346419 RepID=UPI0036E28DA7
MSSGNSLVYGYLRISSGAGDEEVRWLEQDMGDFAKRRGLQLDSVFHECVDGSLDAFNELVETLRSTGADKVIVPSLRHFGENDWLQNALLDHLEFSFSAQVHALDATSATTETPE